MLASYGTACSTGNTALMAMNRSRSCHLLGWADDCICDVNLEKTLPCISFDRRLTRGELGTAVSDELLVSELLLESHRQTPACTQWSTQTAACTQLWTITAVHTQTMHRAIIHNTHKHEKHTTQLNGGVQARQTMHNAIRFNQHNFILIKQLPRLTAKV